VTRRSAGVFVLLLLGCRASVQGDANANVNGANAKLDADLEAQIRD
jgi:hypothetical protein